MYSLQETVAINNKAVEEWQAKQSNLSYQANADSVPVDIRASSLEPQFKGEINLLTHKLLRGIAIAQSASILDKVHVWEEVGLMAYDVAQTVRYYAESYRKLI